MDTGIPLTVDGGQGRAESRTGNRPLSLRIYLFLVAAIVIGSLAAEVLLREEVRDQLRSGAPWVLALFLVEMFPIPVWRDIRVSFGYPLIMFLAVLYEPGAVGLFVLVGSGDPREFTGESDVLRTLFNRSQVAAAAVVASTVFHAVSPEPHLGPGVLGVAVLASAAELAVNMLLVSLAARLDYGVPLRSIIGKMPVGNAWLFEAAYMGLGVLGVVMALLYLDVGPWAVVGLILPLLSIRHMIKVSARLEQTQLDLDRETAKQRVAAQLASERYQERQRLAALLHDELGPILGSASMHLDSVVGEVEASAPQAGERIRSALAAGRAAQKQVRMVIGQLLQSPSGPDGLSEALRRLVVETEATNDVVVRQDVAPIEAPHPLNELLFAIAREATRNAVRHGRASTVEVTLRQVDGQALLTVIDDGTGFDPATLAEADGHYGLRLLRQQTETCGGTFSVTSAPARGTAVTAQVPLRGPDASSG